ncbi:phage tail tip fiber protein [Pseudomonas chlororaphis]|uniref:Bacteriophage host specificity protein n=1 Tax=Pseudomonas chlororaphis O6 TaxID=1037915 RepID=A0AB33WLW3_9PSED|nr:DUF1983 domain-containing protein [Pseudomonas chlororaphis]EIM14087.1 bacteriophage host specificity protein [Pseudomonas chlororaphis O6]
MQSRDYVPGVSGWKFVGGGAFEINAKSITVGGLNKAPERQVVSVEVCSYSKYDLPKNAANLLQFMQAELQKVPEEFRHAAEFEEFDTNYGDDSFNPRLFLSYSRFETEEELADRIEKSKVAGTCIKIEDGVATFIQDGVTRIRIGNLEKAAQPEPFIVIDGVTYISEAEVERASITNAKIIAGLAEPVRQGGFFSGGYTGDGPENGSGVIAPGTDRLSDMWSVKMEATADGKYVASGLGLGIESQFLVEAGRLAIKSSVGNAPQPGDALKAGGVTSMLDAMASTINETPLGKDLLSEINKPKAIADQVRDVIRVELRPGGMLHLR